MVTRTTAELGRVVRFVVVGVMSTLTYFVIALGCSGVLGISTIASSFIGQIVAAFTSYFGHKSFTFAVSGGHRQHMTRFVLIAVPFGFGLNAVLSWTAADLLRLRAPYVFGIVAITLPIATYILNRWVVFNVRA